MEKIEEFTRDISFDQLMADEWTKDAIFHNLQVIGEASIVRGTTIPPGWISLLHLWYRE